MRCHDAAIEPETWHMRPLSFYMLYPTDYGHTKAKSQIPLPNKLGYKGLVWNNGWILEKMAKEFTVPK